MISATLVAKLETPISTITLIKQKFSVKAPIGQEVVVIKQQFKEENVYVINFVGKVKMKTIKTGTMSASATGKVNVYLVWLPVEAKYNKDFSF